MATVVLCPIETTLTIRTTFRLGLVSLAAVAAAWCLATPAYAYLDPGAGNTLLQGVIGGIAVATGVAAYYWRRLCALFARQHHDSPIREHLDR
jgi:hypothetical protein